MTLDSIRNSCDVYFNALKSKCEHKSMKFPHTSTAKNSVSLHSNKKLQNRREKCVHGSVYTVWVTLGSHGMKDKVKHASRPEGQARSWDPEGPKVFYSFSSVSPVLAV